jgi:hypothetical protein
LERHKEGFAGFPQAAQVIAQAEGPALIGAKRREYTGGMKQAGIAHGN